MRSIKVGSRESRLAIVQAELVMAAIRLSHPKVEVELVTMKTTGDRILDRPLEKIGGKGLFVKELDDALRDRRVDICVHSYKDMPVPDNPELPVVAVGRREDPRDVLVLPKGCGAVRRDLPIGTSSLRRQAQLSALFPDCRCAPVRGNLTTRLNKLDAGEYGALVLAAAGLRRLGLWERMHRIFSEEEIIPAACQGMLAVQGRAGEDHAYLAEFHDFEAFDASQAERSLIEALGATCASPVAAYAAVAGDAVRLSGLYVNDKGLLRKGVKTGTRAQARMLGEELARELGGAKSIR